MPTKSEKKHEFNTVTKCQMLSSIVNRVVNLLISLMMKGNSKRNSGNSLSPFVAHNRVIGATLKMLLTEVKLRLRSRLYNTSFPKS